MSRRRVRPALRHAAGALIVLPLIAVAQAAPGAEDIDGVWRTEPRDSGAYITVRIEPCAGEPARRCGVITGAHDGARADIVGEQILRGMEQQADGSWASGEIIRPVEGTVYSSRLRLAGAESLDVEGCVIGGLICKGQQWTRVK